MRLLIISEMQDAQKWAEMICESGIGHEFLRPTSTNWEYVGERRISEVINILSEKFKSHGHYMTMHEMTQHIVLGKWKRGEMSTID